MRSGVAQDVTSDLDEMQAAPDPDAACAGRGPAGPRPDEAPPSPVLSGDGDRGRPGVGTVPATRHLAAGVVPLGRTQGRVMSPSG